MMRGRIVPLLDDGDLSFVNTNDFDLGSGGAPKVITPIVVKFATRVRIGCGI